MLVKTKKEFEYIVESIIKENFPQAKVIARPHGYLGLVLVENVSKEELEEIPEVERVIPIYAKCKAELEEIAKACEEVAKQVIPFSSFLVCTTRRGKAHEFSSIDCEKIAGAKIKEVSNAAVDLESPEKIFLIEIINEDCYVGVISGKEIKRKYVPGKADIQKLLKKIVVVQLPYLEAGAKELGERIGRAAQSYEIKELIIAPCGKVDAFELIQFLRGVNIGVKARYDVQTRIYPRKVRKVNITLQSMYEVFRDKTERKKSLVIVTDPLGEEIAKIKEDLKKDLLRKDEIVIFIGSREGLPKGFFRKADYVIDLAPYITFATELAIPAAITALIDVYEEGYKEDTKLVIFDLDGTLIDSIEFHVKTFEEACKELGIKIDEKIKEEFRKRLGKRFDEIVKEILPELSQEDVKKLNEIKWKLSEEFMKEIKPIENAINFIKSAPENYEFAIFSSSPKKFVAKTLEMLGILDKFKVIIGKENVKEGKPSPEGIFKILEKTGIKKESVIFIGDSEYDKQAAERAGIKFLHISEISELWKELTQTPTFHADGQSSEKRERKIESI